MVIKVQVMNNNEIKLNNKIRNEQDKLCDKIKFCLSCSLLIFSFVYLVVLVILLNTKDNDIDIYYYQDDGSE